MAELTVTLSRSARNGLGLGLQKTKKRGTTEPHAITVNEIMAGTPAYMPPDFMARGSQVDAFVDRYGVGVMLYELVTGSHPYASALAAGRGLDPAALADDPRKLRPDVSDQLGDFLMQSVAGNEVDRFASATQMLEAWTNLKNPIRDLA